MKRLVTGSSLLSYRIKLVVVYIRTSLLFSAMTGHGFVADSRILSGRESSRRRRSSAEPFLTCRYNYDTETHW